LKDVPICVPWRLMMLENVFIFQTTKILHTRKWVYTTCSEEEETLIDSVNFYTVNAKQKMFSPLYSNTGQYALNWAWTHWALDSRLHTLLGGWDGTCVMTDKRIHWAHTTSHLLSPSWAAGGLCGRGCLAVAGTWAPGGMVCRCMRHTPNGMSPHLHGRKSLNMGLDICMSDSQIHPAGSHVGMGHICAADIFSGLPTK
jgi:hypothetical protein